MSLEGQTEPQVAVLVGATHRDGEPGPRTLVFHLEDRLGTRYAITLGTLF